MRVRNLLGVIMLGALLASAGCTGVGGQKPGAEGAAGTGAAAQGAAGAGAAAEGAQVEGGFKGSPLEDPQSPLSKKVFYFPFDSSEISAEDRDTLIAHGRYLADHPKLSVVVEGHTDERGSREYNLALGERRARAVEQLLMLQGAGKEQLQVISFGEERPVALGHDESAWALNRRVELLYSGN